MKKLIVIAVVFALVAGVAFAETRVSGTIDTRIRLVDADNNDDNDATIGGVGVADGYVQLSGQDDDAKFGGLVRIKANPGVRNGAGPNGTPVGTFHRAFAWWQPIPQLKIFLGQDKDGMFATGQLTDWAFHQGAEGFVSRHDWDYWRAIFPGNWDNFGLAFSVYPVPGVDINLVIPTGAVNSWPLDNDKTGLTWKTVPAALRLQSGIGIPDIGKIFISYQGPSQNGAYTWGDKPDGASFGNVGVSFYFTMIEGLAIQAGFATDLVGSDGPNRPIHLGLAAHYTGGDWGVKFRLGTQISAIGPSYQYQPVNQNANLPEGNYFAFNVMPWYNLGFMTGYFDIGAEISIPDGGDADIYFWLNPYVRKSIGPGALRAGIMVGIDPPPGDGDAHITFQIPVQFVYSF